MTGAGGRAQRLWSPLPAPEEKEIIESRIRGKGGGDRREEDNE